MQHRWRSPSTLHMFTYLETGYWIFRVDSVTAWFLKCIKLAVRLAFICDVMIINQNGRQYGGRYSPDLSALTIIASRYVRSLPLYLSSRAECTCSGNADMHSDRQSTCGSHRARDSPGSCVLRYICNLRDITSQFSWLLTVCVSILGPVELTRLLPVRRCAFLNFVEQVCVSDLGCSIYVLVLTCLNSIVRCVSNRVCVCIQRYSCL